MAFLNRTRGTFQSMSSNLRYITAALLIAACAGPGITDAPRSAELASARLAAGSNLIQCTEGPASSADGLVTPLGGVVTSGGTTITIPPGAVAEPTLIQVEVPASKLVETDISVPGLEHFEFLLPVTVTVSYAHCSRANIDRSPITAWYIDTETKALLEHMGGIDNKLTRTVTFTTPHLSGYALAN
jgi:hypothetical protein